jgi:hypothetical protein
MLGHRLLMLMQRWQGDFARCQLRIMVFRVLFQMMLMAQLFCC